MSENSVVSPHPELDPANSRPLPLESAVESPAKFQDRYTPTRRQTRGSREEEEKRGEEPEEVRRLRRDVGGLKGQLDRERAEVARLRKAEEKLVATCKRREDRITKLYQEIDKMRSVHQGALEEQARQARALEERLKRTEELLAARSAELSETRTFLSTTDRLSEVEVLGIVRDLNENIFQVAVSLADEWEKLEPSQATSRMDVDPASLPSGSALIQLARNRDLMGLTYLLQSCLCSQAARMTSSWSRHRELATLKSVHERLSASGEHHNSAAGNVSLTCYRGASNLSQVEVVSPQPPPPTPASLRTVGRAAGESPLRDRIIPVIPALDRIRSSRSPRRNKVHDPTCNAPRLHVHGGCRVQRHVSSIRGSRYGVR